MKSLLVLLICIPSLAFATIGDTPEEIHSKASSPPLSARMFDDNTAVEAYNLAGLVVLILYFDNHSVAESYYQESEEEIQHDTIATIAYSYCNEWTHVTLDGMEKSRAIYCPEEQIVLVYGPFPMGGTIHPYVFSIISKVWFNHLKSDT